MKAQLFCLGLGQSWRHNLHLRVPQWEELKLPSLGLCLKSHPCPLLLVSLGHTSFINCSHTNACLTVCFCGMQPKAQGIPGGSHGHGETAVLERWKVWVRNNIVYGLWLETVNLTSNQVKTLQNWSIYWPIDMNLALVLVLGIYGLKKKRWNLWPGRAYITGEKK